MKRSATLLIAAAALLFFAATAVHFAQDPGPPAPAFGIGGKVNNLPLRDLKGQSFQLYDLGRAAS